MKKLGFILMALGMALLTLRAQPVFLTQPASRVVWAGAKVTLASSSSTLGQSTYQWLINGTNAPCGTQVSTIAGNGTNGYTGDGGPATNAMLNFPSQIIRDPVGNLFFSDNGNARIREINTNGLITTIAGDGTNGFAGDGGPATNGMLNGPNGLALDAAGDLYIADVNNDCIRKVDTNGLISTVAGNGTYGNTGDGGPALAASLANPQDVNVDAAGNFYITGSANDGRPSFVRRVDTNGIITTVAGNGMLGFSGDGGPATNASLTDALGVAFDAAGNMYIADSRNYRIRKVDTNGIITTFAGNGNGYSGDGGAATNAGLSDPQGVVFDPAGRLYFSDGGIRIRRVDTNGIITTVAGTNGIAYNGDGGLATNTTFSYLNGLAIDAADDLFLADANNQRIRLVLSPQWPDSIKPTLVMNNVFPALAGNYQEVITAANGTATSSVASLVVATSPFIYQTVPSSGGGLALSLVSQPGSTNVVLGTASLLPPVLWQPISTNTAGTDGDWQFTDTNAPVSPVRFYRSLTQ